MPQRSSIIKAPEPTSLRRSPRLLQFNHSPQTPNVRPRITQSHPTPLTLSVKCKNGVKIGVKSCKNLEKCDNGSVKCGKSANGSVRKSRLSGRVEGIDGSFVRCNTRSRKGSKKLALVEIDSLAVQECVDVLATPVLVGEKKVRGVEISDFSERRITRSCARKLGSKLEVIGIGEDMRKVCDFGKHCGPESKTRTKKTAVVRPVGGGRGRSNVKAKEDRSDVCGVIGSSLAIVDCDTPVLCVTPGVRQGRRRSLKDNDETYVEVGEPGRELGENSKRRITRSVSKQMAGGSHLSKRVAGKADSVLCVTPGGRQGRRRSLKDNDETYVEAGELGKEIGETFERRITRSVSKQMAGGSDLSKHLAGKADSRKTNNEKQVKYRSKGVRKRIRKNSIASFSGRLEAEETAMGDIDAKERELDDAGEQGFNKVKISSDVGSLKDKPGGERKTQDIVDGTKAAGVKRKRKQTFLQGADQGWTKEQQLALQKAYFTAKPSPHFWKKVSKLVPGKSAQECFDKVHSDNLTPLSVRRSSRIKKQDSPSDLLFSGNELFKSAGTKRRKTCKTRQKSHVARRNVRHLLQKHCHVNQDSELDLFSILEPTVNPSAEAFKQNAVQSTPKNLLGRPWEISKFGDRSSSGLKQRLSRFSRVSESPLTSPPVLKKVKNMTLHEKYIDQLHIREGKRKVASARYFKSLRCQKDVKNPAQMKDAIRAAKDALVSDAQDVIDKFRDSQANLMEAYSDSDEVFYSDDDEDDIVR